MKHFFTILLLTGVFLGYSQQYPLYTNYVFNCFTYNPAIAGTTDYADLRLVYRSQWLGLDDAPETQVATFHTKMKYIPFGVGAYFYNDQAGALQRTGASGIVSYIMDLDEDTKLSIGLSAGMYNIRLNGSMIKVEDDLDQTVFNGNDGDWTPDFSAGIYLIRKNYYFGVSSPQVLESKIKFSEIANSEDRLVRHYYFLTGIDIPISKALSIEPSVMAKYVPAAPWQFDVAAKFKLYDYLWFGATFRTEDAVAAMIGINVTRGLEVSYAYDVTTSNLKNFSSGSHEICVGYKFGLDKDTDRDGVPDVDDKCPEDPGPKENDGCPLDSDRDGDGILDIDDECPDVPGVPEKNGCPFNDRDLDGIEDELDKCPDVPGVPENEGCPKVDTDGDGLADDEDDCPTEPGPISNRGCPLGVQDSDGDGVADNIDECPRTYGPPENNGCPIVTEKQQEAVTLALVNLEFEFDKYTIKASSFPYLDGLAQVLVNNRDWQLRLAGHADALGTFEYNLELSKNRAEAVMYYLISRGVLREQLVVEYFGEGRPIDSNETELGRSRNRRVEMDYVFN